MHVYINSDGVSVDEFKVVIIILRSSYTQKVTPPLQLGDKLLFSYSNRALALKSG